MSFKKLLELESTDLTEEEIIKVLVNASKKKLEEVEFKLKNSTGVFTSG